jgi:imidazolonepropionase-like amidohydrolase
MLVAVHALSARGGHCDNTGYPYQRFGPEPGIADGIASGPDQFRDAVRFQVKYGAAVIKVCATGGVLSLGDDSTAASARTGATPRSSGCWWSTVSRRPRRCVRR